MKRLRNVMERTLQVLAGSSFLVMIILTCWQVVTRYVLKNPSSWSEELVSYLFAWMALLGAALVAGERGHMNIPILVERMGGRGRKIFAILAEIVACLFAVIVLLYGGVRITSLAMGQMTSSLGVSVGIFYIVLPLSGFLNIGYAVMNIVEICDGETAPEIVDETRKKAQETVRDVAQKIQEAANDVEEEGD